MKRFIAFGYDSYYPAGAFNDMIGDFDTLEDAKKCAESGIHDWHDIFDMQTGEIVSLLGEAWVAPKVADNNRQDLPLDAK